MSSKMAKVFGLAVALVAAFAFSACAELMTPEERAGMNGAEDRHYVEVSYPSEAYQQSRELQAAIEHNQDVFVPDENRTHVDVAYDAEDFAEARETMAMEEHGANPFAEVQHVAQDSAQQNS